MIERFNTNLSWNDWQFSNKKNNIFFSCIHHITLSAWHIFGFTVFDITHRNKNVCHEAYFDISTHNTLRLSMYLSNYLSHLLHVNMVLDVSLPCICQIVFFLVSVCACIRTQQYSNVIFYDWQIRPKFRFENNKTRQYRNFSASISNSEFKLLVRILVDSIMSALIRFSQVFGKNAQSMVNKKKYFRYFSINFILFSFT